MSKLFLIVGNSGSGKDSLIKYIQKNFPKDLKGVKVPKRVITRPPSPDTDPENYESIDESSFLKIKEEGGFALDWYIYNTYYGIRNSINDWLSSGNTVLINISRKIIDMARKKIPNLKVILVTAPFELIVKRIKERGRESEESINKRLERAKKFQNSSNIKADFIVNNDGKLEDAGKKMLDYILSEI